MKGKYEKCKCGMRAIINCEVNKKIRKVEDERNNIHIIVKEKSAL